MKKAFLFFCTLFFVPNTFSQVNLDSLWGVWEDVGQADTSRLKAVIEYARKGYLFSQPDSAFYFAQLGYERAQKTGHEKEMAFALNTQGYSYFIRGDYEMAFDHYDRSLSITDRIGDRKGSGAALNNIGMIHMNQGDNAQAIDYYSRSLEIQREIGNAHGVSVLLNNLGIIYMDMGDHARAIDHYSQSLLIQKGLGNTMVIINTLNNIGNIYQEQEDYARALEYYSRSLAMAKETDDQLGVGDALSNMALVYWDMDAGDEGLEQSLDLHLQSLSIFEKLGQKRRVATVLNNLGNIYRYKGDTAKALHHYERSLRIREEIGDKQGMAASLGSIGLIHSDRGEHSITIFYRVKALKMAQEAGEPRGIRHEAKALYKSYKTLGNTAKALEMHELYITMRDSIMSEENQRETIRTEFSREAEQQQNKITLLNLENEKKAAETLAERNKRYLTMGAGGFLIVSLLGGGFFIQRSRKQKHRLELNRAELEKNLIENDFLRSRLDPHFVSNALMSINELVIKNETTKAEEYIVRFNQLMRWTLENASRELVTLDEELEMIEHYLTLEKPRIGKNMEWTVEVAENVERDVVELPPLILQPLVENAIKHGIGSVVDEGRITIKVEKKNGRVVCSITDNGIGMKVSDGVKETSHGLRLTRERLGLFSKLHAAEAIFEMKDTGNGSMASVSFQA